MLVGVLGRRLGLADSGDSCQHYSAGGIQLLLDLSENLFPAREVWIVAVGRWGIRRPWRLLLRGFALLEKMRDERNGDARKCRGCGYDDRTNESDNDYDDVKVHPYQD